MCWLCTLNHVRKSMRVSQLIIITLVLAGCARSSANNVIKIGMKWSEANTIIRNYGWVNAMVKFELEKEFSDKGGKMYSFKHPSESIIFFSTMPRDGNEILIDINPHDGMVMGRELHILSLNVE